MDFNQAPLLVIWETTQACDLACASCRSSSIPDRNAAELTTEEGRELLAQVKEFGNPVVVLTGGDPLKRPDLSSLIRYSVALGLRTNITPSATPLLTIEAIDEFERCGICRMAIHLDGPDAAVHDGFRGQEGSYDRSVLALRHAREIGMETQVHTTVTGRNMNRLAQIAEQVADFRSQMWCLFFALPAGCAPPEENLSGEECDKVFEFLYSIMKVAPFEVKTAEAMHYRPYVARRIKNELNGGHSLRGHSLTRNPGVSEGRGFVFISHTGDIYPSGFLPLRAGNVRQDSLVDVYRNSNLFRILRDPAKIQGKCGCCEFGRVCGGSRAQAYALTGSLLAADPRCTYQPESRFSCASAS